MPLDAPTEATADPPPQPHATADAFRLLAARLRRQPAEYPFPTPVPETEWNPQSLPPPRALTPPRPPSPGETAAALLEIMWGAVGLPPPERSMAGDALLLLLPDLSPRDLAMLAERVATMEQPPPLLVSRLLRDPRPGVGGTMLERSARLDTAALLAVCRTADSDRLRMVARRRGLTAPVAEQLVIRGDAPSLLILLRNPDVEMSFDAFLGLAGMAARHPNLQVPLTQRADLPIAVALELFWHLPPDLRRVVTSRFLSDSVTLGRILSLAQAARQEALPASPPQQSEAEDALSLLADGSRAEAEQRLSVLTGAAVQTIQRILSDADGDALVALLKALGLGRARFDAVLERIRSTIGIISVSRSQDELKAVFDALSLTKARILLIYWDLFMRKAGPFAPPDPAGLVEPPATA